MAKLLSACLLIAALCLLMACGRSSEEKATEKMVEKMIEEQSGGKVKADISKDKVEIRSQEGDLSFSSGGAVEVPKGFPKDVFVYSKAKAKMSAKQENGFMLMLESQDDVKKVGDAYKNEMKSQAWEEKSVTTIPEGMMLQYEKEKRHAIIAIMTEEGKTRIQITTSAE